MNWDAGFMPHAFCLQNDTSLIVAQLLANTAIAAAYFAIPFLIRRLLAQRNLSQPRTLSLFAAFIFCCGCTHLMDAVVLFFPLYYVDTGIRVLTGIISMFTAFYFRTVVRATVSLSIQSVLQQRPSVEN